MPTFFEHRERAARITLACEQFVASNPDFAQFNSGENIDTIVAYIADAWGGESKAVESVSSYEIAFQALRGKLRPIPGYVAPISQEMRERVRNTTGTEFKRAYQRDPAFKLAFDTIAEEEGARKQASIDNPFLHLTAAEYSSIPSRTREFYADDPRFQAAVQRLRAAAEEQ